MLDRQHLHIIQQIHRLGTMTEAAKSLYLSQSALSHAMKKVENTYGVAIWQKEGRLLRLTQAGEALLNLADKIIPLFEYGEESLRQLATGKHGVLRVGMECHPCYQWLLSVVDPFLASYPGVDIDVRQAFKFGGLKALHGFEIDLLITPDPLYLETVKYTPVFEYEQMLAVANSHPLANKSFVSPEDLSDQVVITYPVEISRLDVFAQFLTPAGVGVKQHKVIETTEIMLQMVANERGVAALPGWLIDQYAQSMPIKAVRLGQTGVQKTLYLGYRSDEAMPDYLAAFIELAKQTGASND